MVGKGGGGKEGDERRTENILADQDLGNASADRIKRIPGGILSLFSHRISGTMALAGGAVRTGLGRGVKRD